MIVVDRLTSNEHAVLTAALALYDARMVQTLESTHDEDKKNNAQWRHFQSDALMRQLRQR